MNDKIELKIYLIAEPEMRAIQKAIRFGTAAAQTIGGGKPSHIWAKDFDQANATRNYVESLMDCSGGATINPPSGTPQHEHEVFYVGEGEIICWRCGASSSSELSRPCVPKVSNQSVQK